MLRFIYIYICKPNSMYITLIENVLYISAFFRNICRIELNVVCRYLRQFLGTSFGVATLPISCNIEYGEGA